jgi:hypothetical protein
MNTTENKSSAMSSDGSTGKGAMVMGTPTACSEQQPNRIEVVPSGICVDAQLAERIRSLQRLFAEWTEEDGKLRNEDADVLGVALDASHGLGFHASNPV